MAPGPITDEENRAVQKDEQHSEYVESLPHWERDSLAVPTDIQEEVKAATTGTVNLIATGTANQAVVLVPAPSSDPRDPLNLPQWQKYAVLVILSIWSCTGNTVVSAAGALISFFLQDYIKAGKGYADITHLITIPTLSMGLGDLILIPLALAIGRRPVYLFSGALLFVACIIASQNTSYEYHLAIRVVLGIAAGQSGALVPLMLKELFFLHERANVLSMQAAGQTIVGCVLTIFAPNIAAGVGWKNWYAVYAGLSGFLLICAFFLVPETKYERPLEAYNGLTATVPAARTQAIIDQEKNFPEHMQVTQANRPQLDTATYPRHNLLSRMNPMPCLPDWSAAVIIYKHCAQMLFFPNVMLIILMNSWYLGVNIAMGTTYATALEAPPYNWASKWVGVAQSGQIVVAFICIPALGIGSDKLIQYMARRNNGVHIPEVRLLVLFVPIIIGVVSDILFGVAYDHPYSVHWFAIIFAYCGSYFAFIAASVAGQTYLLDAYPTRTGTVLTLVCVCRGLISFGLTYSLVPTTDALGHVKAYGMYAGVASLFGILGVGLYFFGPRMREWTQKWVKDDAKDAKAHIG